MKWFTSDQHFQHINILAYTKRPFESLEDMREKLIYNHNSLVSHDDDVYHLGDFTMGNRLEGLQILSRLSGKHHLVIGNHDKPFEKKNNEYWTQAYKDAGFLTQEHVITLDDCSLLQAVYPGILVRLNHFPVKEAEQQDHTDDIRYEDYRLNSLEGVLHLHGHTHASWPITHNWSIHVGVESWNYRPVSEEQLVEWCLNYFGDKL